MWIVVGTRWVSLLCDMSDIAIWSDIDHFSSNFEIFISRYGNLYILYDMAIFTLRYENLYFAIWYSIRSKMKSLLWDMRKFTLRYETQMIKHPKMYLAIWDTYRKLNIVHQTDWNIILLNFDQSQKCSSFCNQGF